MKKAEFERRGVKVMVDDYAIVSALFRKQNTRMTMAAVLDALSERETFPPPSW